ncbi:hypothetical protein [Christensenella minuta]|nr:hypothetical protein [Christensenella minuta]MDY3752635.1 hypothetical protein [Christensenella minuta]
MMAALGFALRSACLRMQEGFAGGSQRAARPSVDVTNPQAGGIK